MLEAKLINALIYALITVSAFFNVVLTADNDKSFLENAATVFVHSFQKAENPCSKPITYNINSFDERFGITRKEFAQKINEAADEWNKAGERRLFAYSPNGAIKVNLVYDDRQKITQELKEIDPVIDRMESAVDALDKEFKKKKKIYDDHKSQLLALKGNIEKQKKVALSDERETIVTLEKAYQEQSRKLEGEKNSGKKLLAERNALQGKVVRAVDDFNVLSISDRGEDFTVGYYYQNEHEKRLDVFEFDSKQELKQLLMHELGHALLLDHTSNTDDIMFELNKTDNNKLTKNDIAKLKRACP
jgi:peptidoglycan hydrolase CwlO-like protein